MTVKQLIELLQKHHSERMDCPIAMLNKEIETGKSLDEQVRQISTDVGFVPTEESDNVLVLLEEKDPSEDLHYGRSHPLHAKWKTKVKQWRKHSGISGMSILVRLGSKRLNSSSGTSSFARIASDARSLSSWVLLSFRLVIKSESERLASASTRSKYSMFESAQSCVCATFDS